MKERRSSSSAEDLASATTTFARPLDRLAERVRLIHYDQRGAGRSPTGDRDKLAVAGALEDLDALRAGLDSRT